MATGIKEQTNLIANSVIKNINSIYPIEVNDKNISVSNLEVTGWDQADPKNFHQIALAKAKDKTYGVSIMGDVELKKDGKVIEKKRMKLATIPVMTADGTFTVAGSQYSIDKQLRLKPSVYSRIKQNGEVEAHVNPDGFKQLRFKVDPQSKKLTVNVNQANINAIPILRILGINDTEIKKSFGADIYDANIKAIKNNDAEEIKRFFKSVRPHDEIPETHEEMASTLSEALKKARLDPKVTKITLGHPYEHLDGRSFLRGFEKVINISRGQEQPDDRDALSFKSIHSVEDFIGERIDKSKNKIKFDIENKLKKNDDLASIVNSGHLNQHIFSFFNSAALSEIPSQINPLSIINAHYKTTITGEGGIENEQSIMPESQALHPSHMGFLDPLNTPESAKIGVTLNMTVAANKVGNELHTKMFNVKTKKPELVSAIDAWNHYVALPGQPLKGNVSVVHEGKQIEIPASKVTHQIAEAHHAFTMSTQALLALNHNQGNRAGMASRHINQAISLKHREAPLVQVKSPISDYSSIEEKFGKAALISHPAPSDGVIKDITESHIIFKGTDNHITEMPLFTNFDLQNKAYLHHEIDHLKPGMKFKKGEIIADSNFTRGGVLALGTNLRTAYMPWKGLNFEDGIVISESAAQKLTSNHLFQDNILKDDSTIVVDKKKFKTMYPTKYTKAQMDKIGDNGLAKPEAILEHGDPYALVMHKAVGTQEDLMLNRLHRSLVQPYKDMSRTWEHDVPGAVTKATYNNKNVKIHARYETPALGGDKLALRHGNKGVITAILPDDEMPKTKDGKVVETIISPLSVISRMSMGQLLESSASKIAEKTGKPYLIENFAAESQLNKLKEDMKKHGIEDTEELIDPKTGHSFGKVMVGKPFVERLFKTAKGNLSAHEVGHYDLDNRPTTGGDEGSKAVDPLTLYGLINHGARGILNEVSTIKGDGNAQFWQNLQNGLPLPKPQIPFVYKKFEGLLNAAGINVKQDGSRKTLAPLTDKETHELAGTNELKNFRMLDHNLEPIVGGMFDPQLTGGSNGQKWSKITLAHPVVNPQFESAVKSLLSLKDSEFKSLIGEENGHNKIKEQLKAIDPKTEIDSLTAAIPHAPKTKKDKMMKRLKILKSLDSLKLTPEKAYMVSVVPVIPPQFRPIFEIPGGSLQTNSMNYLYRDLGLTNEAIKELGQTPELSNTLYQSLGAIQGIMSPISKSNENKEVKGAIQIITSTTSPKHGFFQQKVLRKQQDSSGRASAILNNNLHMDQIAIPEKIAKVIYKPFAIKELINSGYTHKEAVQHIDDFTETGKKAVKAAMSDRPVMMNRAPSLHKFSIMAFQPTLTKGYSIEVPGLIVKPYGLDFDGDTCVLHVPATEKGRKEAFDLMPSKNLYNPRDRSLNYILDQEATIGLHLLSQDKGGVEKVNALLPNDIEKFNGEINKKEILRVLDNIAKQHPQDYNTLATKLKELGDNHGTDVGFSMSLTDLPDTRKIVDKHFSHALKVLHSNAKDSIKLDALNRADASLKADVFQDKTNNFVKMAISGAKGNANNIAQINYAPGLMSDHNGQTIMRPVLSNYGQGMPFADYWTALYGARKGTLDKQLMTSKPGALSKEVVNTTMSLVVSEHDCGTKDGLPMSTTDAHIIGRYDERGHQITKEQIDQLRKKHDSVIVRSPTTCHSIHGICQKCYGIDEFHRLPKIGDNIGVKSAQAVSEPLTQAAMKTFHTGGTASGGGGVFGGFEAVNNFLLAPETFKNRATMSTINGEITSIIPGSAGGHYVRVNEIEHFVYPHSGELLVKKGDNVKKGDVLNHGIPHPKDAIALLGEKAGLHKITDTLHKIYKDSDIRVDRRNVETVVRGMTGFGKITDEGSHDHFIKGDIVPLANIAEWNSKANKPENKSTDETYGMILNKNYGEHKAGTRLDKSIIKNLSKQHKELEVKHSPVEYERTLLGVRQAPQNTQDFLAHLGFRYLKRGLQEGATYGYSSDIHGFHPIPSFVTGQLGDASPDGRY